MSQQDMRVNETNCNNNFKIGLRQFEDKVL